MANKLQEKTVFFDDRAEECGVLMGNCAQLEVQPDAGYTGISKLQITTGWYTYDANLWMGNDVPIHLQGTGQEVSLQYLYCDVPDILNSIYSASSLPTPPSFSIADELDFLIACTDPFCTIRPSFFIETYDKIQWSTSSHVAELPTEVRWRLTDVRVAQSDSCSWIFNEFTGHNLTATDCRIVLKFTATSIYSDYNNNVDQYDTPLSTTAAYFVSTITDPNHYYLIGMHTNSGVGSRSRRWDGDESYLDPFQWGSPTIFFWLPPNE